jgi:hypothetical protein
VFRRVLHPDVRDRIADWLLVAAAGGLLASLFLPWSHQGTPQPGVPSDPTAWQVFSVADVLLAVLAVAVLGVALLGGRRSRGAVLAAVALAMAFVLHALSVPPTVGANVVNPASGVSEYLPRSATAATGETVALAGLGVAVIGLAFSAAAGQPIGRPYPR